MKKGILIVLLPIIFFVSCKKDNKTPVTAAGKTHLIKFNIAGLAVNSIGVAGSNLKLNNVTAITDAANMLYYVVYGADGKLVNQVTQLAGSGNFGTISDNLKPGDYTILFVAGQGGTAGLIVADKAGNIGTAKITTLTNTFISYATYTSENIYTYNPWQDTFYKKVTLTVAGSDITQDVSLNRVVGEIEIQALDMVPANATRVTLTIDDDDAIDSAATIKTYVKTAAHTATATVPDSVKGTTGFKFDEIIANTSRPFKVTIASYSTSGLINQVTVDNVTCQKNTRTVLSGNLYGASTSGISITFNSVWNPVPHETIHF